MGIQSGDDREKFSRLRQSLNCVVEEVPEVVQGLFSDKPLIRGSVYELKRKCGKSGCKCAKGELHSRMVLSASEKGRTRLRVIPKGSLAQVQEKVKRYQQLRQARARLGELYKKMIDIIDQMEALRREEMGPNKNTDPSKGTDT